MPENARNHDNSDIDGILDGTSSAENSRTFKHMWAIDLAVKLVTAAVRAGSRPPTAYALFLQVSDIAALLHGQLNHVEDGPSDKAQREPLFSPDRGYGLGHGGD